MDALFASDKQRDMAITPTVTGRRADKPAAAAAKPAAAAAPAATPSGSAPAAAATPAVAPAAPAKKLGPNASSDAVLKEVVRLEAALKQALLSLDEANAKEAAASAQLAQVRAP